MLPWVVFELSAYNPVLTPGKICCEHQELQCLCPNLGSVLTGSCISITGMRRADHVRFLLAVNFTNNNKKIFLIMASTSESADITVLSWNINGLKGKLKKHKTKLLKIFDQYDVVLLQETKIGPMDGGEKSDKDWIIITEALPENYVLVKLEDPTCRERTDNKDGEEEEEKKEEEKKMYMTYFSSNRKGVAILINKPHTILNASCEGGEYAWVHVEIDSQKYTFVSVYYDADGPNLIGHLMLKIFYNFLTDGPDAFTCTPVIGGDFNTTLDPELDANKEISRHAPLRKTLNDFMSILKLSDVWRKKHDEARIYTYIQNKEPKKPTKSRLDYIFMLENDVKYVKSCVICTDIALSDHSPVSLTLKVY
ncbi:uncharacterized protein LOC125269663 [Megalobrama amblycephala]|uniref:uncharacterized protein LOC125269663 n=1 Tax=Megalobrama amblycephala TaxID=75352 RepID=UPI0020146C28|nr:uncharacterized protein LOC125269663 [Megalobrama amblycephala]